MLLSALSFLPSMSTDAEERTQAAPQEDQNSTSSEPSSSNATNGNNGNRVTSSSPSKTISESMNLNGTNSGKASCCIKVWVRKNSTRLRIGH